MNPICSVYRVCVDLLKQRKYEAADEVNRKARLSHNPSEIFEEIKNSIQARQPNLEHIVVLDGSRYYISNSGSPIFGSDYFIVNTNNIAFNSPDLRKHLLDDLGVLCDFCEQERGSLVSISTRNEFSFNYLDFKYPDASVSIVYTVCDGYDIKLEAQGTETEDVLVLLGKLFKHPQIKMLKPDKELVH